MATGLSISSTSNLSSGQKILVASAKMAYEPSAPDPDLVESVRIPDGHKQWDILTYARLSDAASLTEGVDLTSSQQLVAASLSVTPAENGIIATLSKRLMRRQGDANVIGSAGTMIANSLRRKQAKDVISLYDGFSKSTPGATNALDITHFRGATSYLMTDNDSGYGPAQPPFHAALHIEQISDIILDITDTAPRGTTTGITDDMISRWWKTSDRLYGVQVYHSGNIALDSGNDAKGAFRTDEQLVEVWPSRSSSVSSRGERGAVGQYDVEADDEVFYLAVTIRQLTCATTGKPSADRRQVDRLWPVSDGDAVIGPEGVFEHVSESACADIEHHRFGVDVDDAFHRGDVEDDTAVNRHAGAAHARSASGRRHRHMRVVADPEHGRDLFAVGWTGDDAGEPANLAFGSPHHRQRPPIAACLGERMSVYGDLADIVESSNDSPRNLDIGGVDLADDIAMGRAELDWPRRGAPLEFHHVSRCLSFPRGQLRSALRTPKSGVRCRPATIRAREK